MRHFLKFAALAAAALPLAWSCQEETPETPEERPVKPEVIFAVEGDSFEAKLNVPTELKAEITSKGPVECSWSVDGEVIATTPTTKYTFTEKKTCSVVFAAFNEAGRVDKTYAVTVVGETLVVTFDKTEDFEIMEGEGISITATVTEGDKDTRHEWKVGNEVKSTSTQFEHTFAVSGDYTVTYTGRNADDETFVRAWNVKVNAKPLDMEYSVAQGDISRIQGEPVFITATAKTGAEGLVHTWRVNDTPAGDAARFCYLFAEAGDYTVTYSGESPMGKASAVWTVKVAARESVFFDDFESLADGFGPTVGNQYVYYDYKGQKEFIGLSTNNDNGKDGDVKQLAVKIKGNPVNSALNNSGKVLADDMSKSSSMGTSGVFNYRFPNLTDRAGIVAVRMKVWFGAGSYYPWLTLAITGDPKSLPSKVNGIEFNPKGTQAEFDALWIKGGWNVIEYDLKTCYSIDNLSGCVQIQPRPFCDFTGSNSSGAADPETNSRIAYFDDIEFLK